MSTSPKQITIFANMRIKIEFTNFAAAILLFAGFAVAAINTNPGNNLEIADFIESESKRILQVPDTIILNLNFQTAKDAHGRAGYLFFVGERKVSIKADYTLDRLYGSLQADTSWLTGYCGMVECQNKPMPAQQRIDVIKVLVSKILTELNGKLRVALAEPAPKPAPESAPQEKEVQEQEKEEGEDEL